MTSILLYFKRFIKWCVDAYDYFLKSTYKLPITQIDREKFCRDNFKGLVSDDMLQTIVDVAPHKACGISTIDSIANKSIRHHAFMTFILSFLSSLPTGWLIVPMVIFDIIQFQVHIFIITQKLLFLYKDHTSLSEYSSDTTSKLMLLSTTIMIGKHRITNMLKSAIGFLSKQLIQRYGVKILTRFSIITLFRQLAKWLGITLTKEMVLDGFEMIIIFLCAVISGIISYWLFVPMARKLQRHLREEYISVNGFSLCSEADKR